MISNNRQIYSKNLIFWLITLNALGYIATILLLSPKIITSFFMQFFMLGNIQNIVTFSLNIFVGLALFYTYYKIISGIVVIVKKIRATSIFLKNLKINTNKANYTIFSSIQNQAFTAGLIHPHIYISSTLLKSSTNSELKAIIFHEQTHQLHHDPLKDLLINFFQSITPSFPGKITIFNHYFLLSEIAADNVAKAELHTVVPLLTALNKILLTNNHLAIVASHFSATTARIQMLVGNKTINSRRIVFNNFILSALLIVSFTIISHTTIFTECHHLLACFSTLFHNTNCLH